MARFKVVDEAEANRIEKEIEELLEMEEQGEGAESALLADDGKTVYDIPEARLRKFAERNEFPEFEFPKKGTSVTLRMVQDLKIETPFDVDEHIVIVVPGKKTFGGVVRFDLADVKLQGLKEAKNSVFFEGAAKQMLMNFDTNICNGCGLMREVCDCEKAE